MIQCLAPGVDVWPLQGLHGSVSFQVPVLLSKLSASRHLQLTGAEGLHDHPHVSWAAQVES